MTIRHWIGGLLLVVVSGACWSQSPPPGKLPVRNWSLAEHDVQVTNRAIEQAPDGRLLVGNGNFLLTFDGARWRQIDTPQGDRLRVMSIDESGRVWVGMPNDFGYCEADATGALVYTSAHRTRSILRQ